MQSWTPRNAQMSYAENNDLITPNWQPNRSILCLSINLLQSSCILLIGEWLTLLHKKILLFCNLWYIKNYIIYQIG